MNKTKCAGALNLYQELQPNLGSGVLEMRVWLELEFQVRRSFEFVSRAAAKPRLMSPRDVCSQKLREETSDTSRRLGRRHSEPPRVGCYDSK